MKVRFIVTIDDGDGGHTLGLADALFNVAEDWVLANVAPPDGVDELDFGPDVDVQEVNEHVS